MSVVLRCPTCGTTQTHSGECDACSEGEVRYFCSNHSPGLWLDRPRCSACGAKFGDAPAVPAAPVGRDAPTRPRVQRPAPSASEPPDEIPWRPAPETREAADADAAPSLEEVLVDMIEEGRSRRAAAEASREPVVVAARAPLVAGCLGRLLFLVLVLIVLALAALSSLFGAELNGSALTQSVGRPIGGAMPVAAIRSR